MWALSVARGRALQTRRLPRWLPLQPKHRLAEHRAALTSLFLLSIWRTEGVTGFFFLCGTNNGNNKGLNLWDGNMSREQS